jgi:hypothetical protein
VGDEISGPTGPPPRRARTVLLVLVAAAVVAAGVVSLRRGVQPPELQPPASPPAAQMPRLPGQTEPAPTESSPPVPAFLVGETCRPPRTDGRTRLDVSFILVNTTARPVTLVRITPVFPLSGLSGLGTEYRSGSCAAPGPLLHTGDVQAHGSLLVVLRLRLPATCPAPLPVEADLTERRDGRTITAGIHLLSDLGGIRFTTC